MLLDLIYTIKGMGIKRNNYLSRVCDRLFVIMCPGLITLVIASLKDLLYCKQEAPEGLLMNEVTIDKPREIRIKMDICGLKKFCQFLKISSIKKVCWLGLLI